MKKNKPTIEKLHEFVETDEVSSTMGYHHYWHREEEIKSSLFERVALDFERLILPLEDAGVRLAGYDGRGLPQIDHSGIVFNGVEECGHPRNPEICIPVPCDTASGIGSSADAIYSSNPLFVELKRRTCNGICRCESFNLPQRVDRRWHQPDEHGRYFLLQDSVQTLRSGSPMHASNLQASSGRPHRRLFGRVRLSLE